MNVPSLQDAGPMGDQNPMAYVHKGGVRILSYLSAALAPYNTSVQTWHVACLYLACLQLHLAASQGAYAGASSCR
jgi:hypothetical protein